MDRKKIKAAARAKLKGNVWTLLMPMIAIFAISFLVGIIAGLIAAFTTSDEAQMRLVFDIFSLVATLLLLPTTVGLAKYYLNFLRGKKFSPRTLFENYKDFLVILVVSIAYYLAVMLGAILLIVPGIIMALGLYWIYYLIADGETEGLSSIVESWQMMKGHKWDFFVFGLSFLGWILLSVLTLGILYIWLAPYMTLAMTMYYEELRKKSLKGKKTS